MWIAAKLRRITAAGGHAAVIHKGDDLAGAIFVALRHRGGLMSCLGPVAQSQSDGAERRLEWRVRQVPEAEVDAMIARERRFDRDLWFVEAECGEALFDEVFEPA